MAYIEGKGYCQLCKIRHKSIFANLSSEQLTEISDFHPTVVSFHSGEQIYRQEGKPKNAFTLRKGLVKLTKSLPDGRTQIVRVLKHGDLFGFDGLAGENYNHNAIALSDCEVCRLPLDDLQDLRQASKEVDRAMLDRWLHQLRGAEDMMLELGAKKAAERLASFLLGWCQDSEGSWCELPLTRGEIGELLGLTIETVSRLFSQWKKNGFVEEFKGKIHICDKDGLLAHVEPKAK